MPHSDYSRYEIRVVDVETGGVRALTGTPGTRDYALDWSPDGSTIAIASEQSGWFELHLVAADGSGARRLTHADADFLESRWHPDGARLVATRGRAGRFDLVVVDATTGEVSDVAAGGIYGAPSWTAEGAIVATYEDRKPRPRCGLVSPGAETRHIVTPVPQAVRAAPHVVAEEVTYASFDGTPIQAFLFRPEGASAERKAPAVVYVHGGPADCYGGEWDGHAQYFVAKGYAWLAINYRGSTGHGSDFERANHGTWGVGDTKDCLVAADFLRTVDWVDGTGSGSSVRATGPDMAARRHRRSRVPFQVRRLQVRRLRRADDVGAGRPRRGTDDDADHGASEQEPEDSLAASPVLRLDNVRSRS